MTESDETHSEDSSDAASDGSSGDWDRRSVIVGLVTAVAAVAAVGATLLIGRGTESTGASMRDQLETEKAAKSPSRPPPMEVDRPNDVDLHGTWAMRTVQTALSKVPMAGEVTAETTSFYVVELRQEGDRVSVTTRACDTHVTSSFDKIQTVLPDAFIDTIPKREREGELTLEGDELQFELEESCRVRGADVANASDGKLPSSPDDDRVVDADEDGHPGVTIRVEGMVEGDLYMVQRGCDAFSGRVVDEDRIVGRVDWRSERSVLDATNMLLGGQPSAKPHPDADKSHFELVRLGGSGSCRTARRAFSK